jgi:hypothetical protein
MCFKEEQFDVVYDVYLAFADNDERTFFIDAVEEFEEHIPNLDFSTRDHLEEGLLDVLFEKELKWSNHYICLSKFYELLNNFGTEGELIQGNLYVRQIMLSNINYIIEIDDKIISNEIVRSQRFFL